jgi:hypothetical protein
MPKERSKAYFQRLCFEPAVKTLRAVLFNKKLNYSEKILTLALLLEPGYTRGGKDAGWFLKRGTLALVARSLGITTSSVSRWYRRIQDLKPFKVQEMVMENGRHAIFLAG